MAELPWQPLMRLLLMVCLGVSGCGLGLAEWAIAETTDSSSPETTVSDLRPDLAPLNLSFLQGNAPPSIVTSKTISKTHLTVPSLWWIKEQYAARTEFGEKLVETWIAYPSSHTQPGRIDLVVNRQSWSILDYLQRYSFIHEFGTTARSYGYNIRVFDNRANFLAAYTCDFKVAAQQNSRMQLPASLNSASPAVYSSFVQSTAPLTCITSLDYMGNSLRGRSNLPGADGANVPGKP